jgi:hypothetical protein
MTEVFGHTPAFLKKAEDSQASRSATLGGRSKVRVVSCMILLFVDYVGVVPDHVRSAVLERTQVGESRVEVGRFLQSRGIGTDGNSVCKASGGGDRLDCYIGTSNHFWNLIRERYQLAFIFDSDQRLKDVVVRSLLEGPGF